MGFYLRGLLLEYGADILGPIPNVVVFQFNPESLERKLRPPADSSAARSGGEGDSATGAPRRGGSGSASETIIFDARFDASDDLGANNARSVVPRAFGVGPQLVALERMVRPVGGGLAGLVARGLDAIGDALDIGDDEGTRPTPPQRLPRILFVWGPGRVLPVEIARITITEKQFDAILNPVRAEVRIELKVIGAFPATSSDLLGRGALTYTDMVKDLEQIANLTEAATDIIPVDF